MPETVVRVEPSIVLPPVKESWFNGYLMGNAMWPKTNMGLRLMTAAAFLKEPTPLWHQFTRSQLSKDQLGRLAIHATYMHAASGIPCEFVDDTVEAGIVNGVHRVHMSRVASLWNTTAGNIHHAFIRAHDPDAEPSGLLQSPFADAIRRSSDFLISEEGRELSSAYRKGSPINHEPLVQAQQRVADLARTVGTGGSWLTQFDEFTSITKHH